MWARTQMRPWNISNSHILLLAVFALSRDVFIWVCCARRCRMYPSCQQSETLCTTCRLHMPIQRTLYSTSSLARSCRQVSTRLPMLSVSRWDLEVRTTRTTGYCFRVYDSMIFNQIKVSVLTYVWFRVGFNAVVATDEFVHMQAAMLY